MQIKRSRPTTAPVAPPVGAPVLLVLLAIIALLGCVSAQDQVPQDKRPPHCENVVMYRPRDEKGRGCCPPGPAWRPWCCYNMAGTGVFCGTHTRSDTDSESEAK